MAKVFGTGEAMARIEGCGKLQRQSEIALKRKSKKPVTRDVVSPFRNKLWDLFRDLAKGMDGAEIVVTLKQAGEEIWATGIDGTYSDMPLADQGEEPLGNAFDIAWLTVACIKIKEARKEAHRANPREWRSRGLVGSPTDSLRLPLNSLRRTVTASTYGAASSLITLLLCVYYSAQIPLFGPSLPRSTRTISGAASPLTNTPSA